MNEIASSNLSPTPSKNNGAHKVAIYEFLVVFSSVIPIFYPLMDSRLFWSHENAYLLWRLAAFHQNAINSAPFCRWFPDFARGLGLPILEFFPVFPVYTAGIFKLLGFSTISSVKLLIIAMTVFAAWGAFLLGKSAWGKTGGFITSVLYSYAPYKLLNIYVRGDLNEYMAMAVCPWILWAILRTVPNRSSSTISIGTIALMSIPAISHYPSCVIQYPLFTIWIFLLALSARQPRRFILRNSISMALALLITSTFWATAFFSRHLVQMEGMTQGFADYRQHFIYAFQWFSFYWNFGASVNGPGDAISFQIGNIAFLCILAALPVLLNSVNQKNTQRTLVITSTSILVLGMFLTHHSSSPIWSTIPVLPLLQFPYRILAVPALMVSLLGGALGKLIDVRFNKYRIALTTLVLLLIIASSVRMCRVGAYLEMDEQDLLPQKIQRASHTHSTGEFIPQAVGKRFPPPKPFTFMIEKIPETGFSREQTEARLKGMLQNAKGVETWEGDTLQIGSVSVAPGTTDIVSGIVEIRQETVFPCRREYNLHATTACVLRINQFYFEGWSAVLNGEKIDLNPDPDSGLILAGIPSGDHVLRVCYNNLPISNYLNVVALFIIIFLLIFRIKRKLHHE